MADTEASKRKQKLEQLINPLEEAKESVGTTLKLVISALALVSGLAWNEAIKSLFSLVRDFFPSYQGRLAEMIILFIYALVVTSITVFAIRRLEKFQSKLVKKKEKEIKEAKEKK